MTAFSITTAKVWITPHFKGLELCVRRVVEKVSGTKNNNKTK
jgi:hypothetical protein